MSCDLGFALAYEGPSALQEKLHHGAQSTAEATQSGADTAAENVKAGTDRSAEVRCWHNERASARARSRMPTTSRRQSSRAARPLQMHSSPPAQQGRDRDITSADSLLDDRKPWLIASKL